jgi:hypothetical protein
MLPLWWTGYRWAGCQLVEVVVLVCLGAGMLLPGVVVRGGKPMERMMFIWERKRSVNIPQGDHW